MNSREEVRNSIRRYAIAKGSFTVPSIAEITGYSTTTVAKYIRQMQEDGAVEVLGFEETCRKGRKSIIYGLEAGPMFYLGVEVKHYGLGMGLMNVKGEMVRISYDGDYTFENTHANCDAVCTKIGEFIRGCDGVSPGQVACVNFNLSGRVDSGAGTSATVYNFEETRSTPLADILTDKLGIKVYIENDTKAMAYGEYYSCGGGWQNVLFVNVSWGLGLGIILEGKPYGGSRGYSGEMGHIPHYDNGILCHCGKKGCVETEVSGAAIIRKLTERIGRGESSVLSSKVRRGEKITLRDIVDATEREDPLCIETVSATATELGKQLAGMINIFNPDSIIIGGELTKVASYYFIQQVTLAIKRYSLKLISQDLEILTSRLGDKAGIIGACMIARDKQLRVLG